MITEAGVWTLAAIVGILLALVCAFGGQWFGVLAGLLAAVNAFGARYFLVCWKPLAKSE